MTQDVRQWLAEIKLLQQKITDLQQERDEAYAGATNWRKLYETEAQQRRTEANLARQTIGSLKGELQKFNQIPESEAMELSVDRADIQHQVEQLGSLEELKQRLTQALLECDRLAQALRLEQVNHAKTRQELTVALGDTVELLTKERAARQSETEGNPMAHSSSDGGLSPAKTPSLELPPLDPAQFPA